MCLGGLLVSFYYENTLNVVINSLNYIVRHFKKDVEIFVHNLNFDGFIIIDSITKNNINFEIFSDKTNIYWIKINYCCYKILFRCSKKIISLSVKSLGLIESISKSFFPYDFVCQETLNYIGPVPNEKY
jgi:hypothetical protein